MFESINYYNPYLMGFVSSTDVRRRLKSEDQVSRGIIAYYEHVNILLASLEYTVDSHYPQPPSLAIADTSSNSVPSTSQYPNFPPTLSPQPPMVLTDCFNSSSSAYGNGLLARWQKQNMKHQFYFKVRNVTMGETMPRVFSL